jgi:hypothetical protein
MEQFSGDALEIWYCGGACCHSGCRNVITYIMQKVCTQSSSKLWDHEMISIEVTWISTLLRQCFDENWV